MASTIKVDNVQNQPGTNIVNKCGTTVTVGAASDGIRSAGNNLQASDGGNLISQSGTDITLGASGDTINLASGASQTGFGRTGTVDWITTPKVTGDSPVTGVTGKGYFLNTTGGVITLNLPAGAAGSIVSLADYAATWQTNNVTVSPNGSEKIGGTNADVTLSTEGQSVTLVYVDSTQGWVNTMDSTSNVRGIPPYIAATGGCITCSGNFKIHTFLGPGTFTVTNAGLPSGSTKVDYLVVAGGGGGANQHSGGGGAGGYRTSFPSPACNAGTVTVSVQGYPIAVGGGGARTPTTPSSGATATPGVPSTFDSFTSAGGGGGGGYPGIVGATGGSGGGGGDAAGGGAGNTPPAPVPQGNPGGTGTSHAVGGGGGGGGAGAPGGSGGNPGNAGAGGVGLQNNIDFNNYYWSGGAGGGAHTCGNSGGNGGTGGGGGGGAAGGAGATGGTGGGTAINAGTAGVAAPGTGATGGAGGDNSGGGGGASGDSAANAANGGSGVVIIRYKYQ